MTWDFALLVLMLIGAGIVGAALGMPINRWRGSGHNGTGRPLCALLISASVFLLDWQSGAAVFFLAWIGVAIAHGDGLDGKAPVFMATTGIMFTGWSALAHLDHGDEIGAAIYLVAGALKGVAYFLPKGTKTEGVFKGKYVWKEIGFGGSFGAASGVNTARLLLIGT